MEKATRICGKIQRILAIVGIAVFAVLWIVFLIVGPNEARISFSVMCPIFIVVFGLTLLFTSKLFKSLDSQNKQTWIGVCNIIFGIVVSGIFYLIWQPTDNKAAK